MSTLDEASIRRLLPKPDIGTPAPSETPIPGTITNTNPPASGPGDALIFDPDENITYDPLRATPTTPEVPLMTQPNITQPMTSSSNVVDLETTPPPSGDGMGWKFWVILVASILVLSLVVFLIVRSTMSSGSQQTAQAPTLENLYGGR
jgi:hypothetical protein